MTSSQAQSSDRLRTMSTMDTEQTDAGTGAPTPPSIEVVGDATPEQVAALVAVLSGIGGGDEDPPAGPPSRWAARDRMAGARLRPGPGGWRASAFPG